VLGRPMSFSTATKLAALGEFAAPALWWGRRPLYTREGLRSWAERRQTTSPPLPRAQSAEDARGRAAEAATTPTANPAVGHSRSAAAGLHSENTACAPPLLLGNGPSGAQLRVTAPRHSTGKSAP
jgi:hypothetical protein